MKFVLCKAGQQLREQFDDSYPDRNRVSDGWIGDTRHIGEVYISENNKGKVDTVFRKFKLTARAAIMQFGEKNVSKTTRGIALKDPYEEISLVSISLPQKIWQNSLYD